MIDPDKMDDESKLAVLALIDELNTHLVTQHTDAPMAFAMSVLDYFAAHVIIGVSRMAPSGMPINEIITMHAGHVRAITERLTAKLKEGQGNGQQS